MLDDLNLFVEIVESGSLNAAAQKLDMPPSTLTRRLQKLELTLGCKLLSRNTRQTKPTQEGWQYFEQCRPLLQALHQTTQHLDETFNQISGSIRILAPYNLANGVLAPAWIEFMRLYPQVKLILELNNKTENLIETGADLAIRVGEQPNSQLNIRRLGAIRTNMLVASEGYLQQALEVTPQNLDQHKLIVAEPLSIWTLQHQQTQEKIRFLPKAVFQVNDLYLALKACCSGVGILYCPLTICDQKIKQGELIHVLPEWQSIYSRGIFAVWSQQHYLPARVRALIDYLDVFFKNDPLLNN